MNNTGCFVADLHMFSRRSQEQRYLHAVSEAATQARLFVLGGDIFDFRWSTLDDVEETVKQGAAWLGALIEQNPSCQFHYVFGNHDYNTLLMLRSEEFTQRYDNFSWHRYYLRIGDKLFLHGDVADRRMDHAALVARREKWETDRKRKRISHLIYDVAIRVRLHQLTTHLLYPPRRVAMRIVNYLDTIGHGRDEGIRHVYFGHTHRFLSNYRCCDLLFHNCGAPIFGLPFEILRFQP